MKFLVTAISFLFLAACATDDGKYHPSRAPVKQKVFYAPYEQVWRATLAVLKYPVVSTNEEVGTLETEYIRGVDGWLPPEQKKPPSSGLRYRIIMNFVRGTIDGRDSTRVTIDKKIEILRDFISEPQAMETDGLEEAVLFYRIERELIIFEALRRAN